METKLKAFQNYNSDSDCCHASQTQSSLTFGFLTHSCWDTSNPCLPPSSSNSRAGQVSSTSHHMKMKLVIQSTRHGFVRVCVCVCVVLQTVLYSLFMSSQLDPILSLLGLSQKKFCSPYGGRKNRKLHSFITITELLQARDYFCQKSQKKTRI